MGIFWFALLSTAVVHNIDDVQVGNCLTFDDMQAVFETERKDIYEGGDCDIDYLLEGELNQDLACGTTLATGEWNRQMVRHKKPGVYWFSKPPCMMSVEFLNYYRTTYAEITEGLACTKENSRVLKYQQEKMTTTKYDVGQGQAYLPSPLWIHREVFGFDENQNYIRTSCTEAESTSSYLGWGQFDARWTEKVCDAEKISKCREAKLTASENEKGQTCLRVDEITDCLE